MLISFVILFQDITIAPHFDEPYDCDIMMRADGMWDFFLKLILSIYPCIIFINLDYREIIQY